MSSPDESLIVKVLLSYFPDWEPPADRGKAWVSCLCPFHGDENPSASVSYQNNAFACHACGEKGNALGIIMKKEGISYREAVEHAEVVSPGSNADVRAKPSGKPRRRVFGQPKTVDADSGVPSGIRRRTTPWS